MYAILTRSDETPYVVIFLAQEHNTTTPARARTRNALSHETMKEYGKKIHLFLTHSSRVLLHCILLSK